MIPKALQLHAGRRAFFHSLLLTDLRVNVVHFIVTFDFQMPQCSLFFCFERFKVWSLEEELCRFEPALGSRWTGMWKRNMTDFSLTCWLPSAFLCLQNGSCWLKTQNRQQSNNVWNWNLETSYHILDCKHALPWATVNNSTDSLRRQGMYFRDWDNYRKALSVVHTLQRFKIYSDMKTFWNRHVDFIGTEMEPSLVIAAMHSLTLLVTGNMQKYYCPEEIGVVLSHARRHCVPSLD